VGYPSDAPSPTSPYPLHPRGRRGEIPVPLLAAELEDTGGLFGVGPVAVEAIGHRDDVGGRGARHVELAVGQG
jgi:hypothetical protein